MGSMTSGTAKSGGRPRKPRRIAPVVRVPVRVPGVVELKGGTFEMGSPVGEKPHRFDREGPQHRETVARFLAGVAPVEIGEYREFVKRTNRPTVRGAWGHDSDGRWLLRSDLTWENPGFEQSDDHPAVCVSWRDATAYAEWLAGETGKPYRLLTEAEWEYMARGGTTTPYHFGNVIGKNANHMLSAERGTCPTRQYGANDFGIYSVHGNTWEWVVDQWRDSYAQEAPTDNDERNRQWGNCSCLQDFRRYRHGVNYENPDPAPFVQREPCRCRAIRGGSWTNRAERHCRSSSRLGYDKDYRAYNIGFRVACSLVT